MKLNKQGPIIWQWGRIAVVTASVLVSIFSVTVAQEPPQTDQCGARIAFTYLDGGSNIYLVDSDGSNQVQLTALTGEYLSAEHPSWSPDGNRIAFDGQVNAPIGSDTYNTELFVIGVDGTDLTRLTYTEFDEQQPSWSPNGDKIAFVTNRDGNWEIYVMNADGSDPVNLTNHEADDGVKGYAWSPEGNHIAFITNRNQGHIVQNRLVLDQIYVMRVDTEHTESIDWVDLTSDFDACANFFSSLSWSPDGRLMAFSACGGDIYIMNADGSEPINLTRSDADDGQFGLSWAPDSNRIVFVSAPQEGGGYGAELFIIDVAETLQEGISSIIQLTHYSSSESYLTSPAWQPCPGSVIQP